MGAEYSKQTGIVQWITTKAPGYEIIKKLYDALYEFKHKTYTLFLTTIISIIGIRVTENRASVRPKYPAK